MSDILSKMLHAIALLFLRDHEQNGTIKHIEYVREGDMEIDDPVILPGKAQAIKITIEFTDKEIE